MRPENQFCESKFTFDERVVVHRADGVGKQPLSTIDARRRLLAVSLSIQVPHGGPRGFRPPRTWGVNVIKFTPHKELK